MKINRKQWTWLNIRLVRWGDRGKPLRQTVVDNLRFSASEEDMSRRRQEDDWTRQFCEMPAEVGAIQRCLLFSNGEREVFGKYRCSQIVRSRHLSPSIWTSGWGPSAARITPSETAGWTLRPVLPQRGVNKKSYLLDDGIFSPASFWIYPPPWFKSNSNAHFWNVNVKLWEYCKRKN